MKLIVNADDYGLSEGVNYGIISAHLNGIVTSTTIMANMPYFEHGIPLLKATPTLATGVHLTLSCGKPLLKTHKTIVTEEGKFYRKITNELVDSTFDLDEVFNEYCAQIELVLSKGIKISHLDSHHHAHTLSSLKPVMERIAEKYPEYPLRGGFEFNIEDKKVVESYCNFYEQYVAFETIKHCLDTMGNREYVDFVCHPAFIDYNLMETTTYNLDRYKEHKILTSKEVLDLVESKQLVLANYLEV